MISRIAFTALFVAATLDLAAAQSLSRDDQELQKARSEIMSIADGIGEKVRLAEESLRAARKNEDGLAIDAGINAYFDGIDAEVRKALNQVARNSTLTDEVMRSKAHAITLLRWLEKQPPEYPNRDAQIGTLEGYIAGYDEQANDMSETHQTISDILIEFGAQRDSMLMSAKIDKVGDSLERLRQVSASLTELSTKLRNLAQMNVVDPNTPASVDQQ